MAIKKNEAIKFNHKHLLGIQYLSIPEVNLILDESFPRCFNRLRASDKLFLEKLSKL